MKNLINYLKALWSWGANSQSSDVSHDCRFTVGSPSGMTAKLQVNSFMRFAVVLTLIFTIGIGNVWGDSQTFTNLDINASQTSATKTPITVSIGGTVTVSGQQFRFASGKAMTVTSSSGNITRIDVTTNSSETYISPLGNNVSSGWWNKTSATKYYWSGDATSVTLTPNSAIRITQVVVTYETAAVAYTITATRNNDSYGTVEVNGTTITATPAAGYRVIAGNDGYTVTSGSATVVNNGDNTFTVTPSSDCTVRINFESKGCTDHGASSITGGALSDADHGPLHAYYDYSTSQILYTKSDLDLAAGKKGTIKSIYFEYSGDAAMAARTIKIYMANTDLSSLTTSNYVPYASFTQVYSGTFSCGSAGWYEITLDTPFDYNGAGQLAVMIDDNTNTYESSKSFKYHSATGKQIYKRQDDTDIDPASWTPASAIDYRPNTKFCIQEADMTPATVTLMDNGATITEASAGAGVALPSREGCAGYTFAGWTKTWVTDQTEWTTTAPTIIPAGSYTPTANENLYPVYTKTEGGGGNSNITINFGYTDWGKGAQYSGTTYDEVTQTKSGITVTQTRNGSNMYANSNATRFYPSNTLTFTSSVGNISSVVFTCSQSKTDITTDVGTCTSTSSELSWSGNDASVTFTGPGTSYAQFSQAVVTVGGGSTTSYISEPACAATHDITFKEWDGGGDVSGSPSTGSYAESATSFSFGATPPSKAGHSIEGFYTASSANSGVKVANSDRSFVASVASWTNESSQITKNSDIDLYIKWTIDHYTITYNAGEHGDGSAIPAGDKTHGSAITLSSNTFTRTGYTQDGWSTTDGGDKDYNLGDTYEDDADLNLYPHWVINNYTVSWMVNGSSWTTGVSASNNNANYNTTVSAPTAPESSDCNGEKVFVGWTTDDDYEHASSAPGDLFTSTSPAITANTTFYAVFATESGGGGGAAIGTTIFSEDFSSFSSGDKMTGSKSSASGRTIYNSGSVTYSYKNGTSADTKIYADNNAGGALPELLVGKYSSTFTISGIPNGGASELTLSYKQNGQALTSSVSGTGYTGGVFSNSGGTTYTTITVGSSASFDLTFTGPSGKDNVRLDDISITVKKTGVSYSDYSTSCGTCLPAPNPITINTKSTSATLSWPAVSGATGYTVTCKQGGVDQGSVSVVGTTATITGLTAENTYQYTVQSVTTDPSYDCFPTKKGTFTTSSCEDVPTISSATATASSITINWDCENATATLYVYSDEACTSEVDSKTVTAKTATIDNLERKTKYYYKVITAGGCPSLVNEITTEEININITEWSTTSITFDFNDDIDATLFLEGRQTEQVTKQNFATKLFFSKYFEAGGNNKMFAIYNGTKDSINLSDYYIQNASYKTEKLQLNQFGKTTGWIAPGEEIVFARFDQTPSVTAKTCAEKEEGFSDWAQVTEGEVSPYTNFHNALTFAGRASIGLYKNDVLIDVIGSHDDGDLLRIAKKKCDAAMNADYNDDTGFYTNNGDNFSTDIVEDDYFLSTNRCLLIRRNTVHSGDSAVKYNRDAISNWDACEVTLAQSFKTLSSEWSGLRIGASASSSAEVDSLTCAGLSYLGHYDYNQYYAQFDTLLKETELGPLKNDETGDYIITGLRLDTLFCGDLRIDIKDKDTKEVYSSTFQVPIMVNSGIETTNSIFTTGGRTVEKCKTCDLVILGTGTLTKATDGTSGDVPQVRNVKVYPGGKLVVPKSTNYTVSSLSMRRQEDSVSMVDLKGGLTVNRTSGVYLDLRIDPTNWHYVSLPYDCNVNDVTFSDGTPAELGSDYYIAWYDGAYRAANKDGGWTDVASGTTLRAGMGYIVSLPGSGKHKKELRFPMSNAVIAAEKADTTVGNLYSYGGDKTDEQLTPNHKGWNLIGNPYMMYYATDLTEPLAVGHLNKDGLTYSRSGSLRYLVTPNVDAGGAFGWSGYSQVPIDTHMKPFTAYFVQIGGASPTTPQGVHFNVSSSGKSSIIARRVQKIEEEDNHPVWYGIELVAPNAEKDKTALLISNDFTDDYDMMDDLVKMRGRYYKYSSVTTAPVLASRNAKEELAFNALPDSSAAVTGVPLNYYAAKAGTYTIRTDSRYDLKEVKSAMLHDAVANTWTNMLENDYTFDAAKGDNTDRFTLYVRVERKKVPEVATGCDNLLDGQLSLVTIDKTLVLSGLTEDADIYVYDMSGKLVRGERANGNGIWRANVPAQGVYFVRVNSAAGQQTLRTIVK